MRIADAVDRPRAREEAARSTRALAGVPLGLAAAGVAGILAMSRWGIGTSPDAITYIRAARYLAGDEGMGILFGYSAVELPLTIAAPFYSLVLAAAAVVGRADPFDAARWVGAALFGVNVVLVAWLVHHVTSRAAWLPSLASFVLLGALPMVTLHGSALSEPLFLALTFTGFLLLARYVERGRGAWLAAAAGCLGLAMLTRYAGAACVLTGVVGLLLLGRDRFGRRLRDAVVFGAICAVPVLLWMGRNVWAGASATGRELGFHPVDRSHLWQAFYTVSGWLQVPVSAPDRLRFGAWLVLGTAGAGLIGLAWRDRSRGRSGPRIGRDGRLPALIGLLALFGVTYGAFLTVSLSLFDANTPLDDRILSPLYVTGLVLSLAAVDRLWPACRRRRGLAAVLVLAAVGFAAVQATRSAQFVVASHARGWGFSSLAWRQSAVLAGVRGLPPDILVYSNAPEVVYLHTGRESVGLPKHWLAMSRQPNRGYAEEMAALQTRMAAEPSVVVYFSTIAQGAPVASERELRDTFGLRAVLSVSDGVILCVRCPQ